MFPLPCPGPIADRAAVRRAAARAIERCVALGGAPFSDTGDGLFRPYLGPAHLAASTQVAEWMREAGMAVRRDAAGSLVGRLEAAEMGRPAFLVGSHLDSVRDAGCFDGVLGVMLGIELAQTLHDCGRRLPFALEVVAFGDEEGSRFPRSMLCSAALAGQPPEGVAEMTDANGVTLGAAMAAAGLDVARLGEAARPPGAVLGYLEAHIEQGPLLDRAGEHVAAVEAIAGIRRCRVAVIGEAGHAGTVPVPLRRDALAAASEMVLLVEAEAVADPSLRTLVGRMEVQPGAVNVIPQRASFTLEVRAGEAAALARAVHRIESGMARIAARRGVALDLDARQTFAPAPADASLLGRLLDSLERCGQPRRRMLSGAGHDAMMLAERIPTVMLFIRSPGGFSHRPDETVALEDVAMALTVMLDFLSAPAGP